MGNTKKTHTEPFKSQYHRFSQKMTGSELQWTRVRKARTTCCEADHDVSDTTVEPLESEGGD